MSDTSDMERVRINFECPQCKAPQRVFSKTVYDQQFCHCMECDADYAVEVIWKPTLNASIVKWEPIATVASTGE